MRNRPIRTARITASGSAGRSRARRACLGKGVDDNLALEVRQIRQTDQVGAAIFPGLAAVGGADHAVDLKRRIDFVRPRRVLRHARMTRAANGAFARSAMLGRGSRSQLLPQFSVPKLYAELASVRGDGRYARILPSLGGVQLLINGLRNLMMISSTTSDPSPLAQSAICRHPP